MPIGDRDEKHDEKRTPPIDVSAVAVVLIVKRGIAYLSDQVGPSE